MKNVETNDLTKRPWWYLFLVSNILVVIGCVATFILFTRSNAEYNLIYLPTLICNLFSFIAVGGFLYFEYKDIKDKIYHFNKRWLKFYTVSIILYISLIVFNVIFFMVYLNYAPIISTSVVKYIALIPYLCVSILLSLVSMGFQRYARFKIDLDMYRRRRGEEIKQEKETLDKHKQHDALDVKKWKEDKSNSEVDKISDKASSGLIDIAHEE